MPFPAALVLHVLSLLLAVVNVIVIGERVASNRHMDAMMARWNFWEMMSLVRVCVAALIVRLLVVMLVVRRKDPLAGELEVPYALLGKSLSSSRMRCPPLLNTQSSLRQSQAQAAVRTVLLSILTQLYR